MQRQHHFSIENKILIPFVTISILSTMVFAAILFYSGYTLKLEKERVSAVNVINSINADITALYDALSEETILKKYSVFQSTNVFIFGKQGEILKAGRMLEEDGLATEGILASSKDNPLHWTICYNLDKTDFYNDLIEEQKYMILATIALLIIIVQSSILIAHNISEPIRLLSETCTEISEDEKNAYGREILFSNRTDEIGQLASSFQSMLNSIGTHTQELTQVKQLNESIVENLPLGVVAYDPNGAVLFCNTKARQMLENNDYTLDGAPLTLVLQNLVAQSKLLHDPIHLQNASGKTKELDVGLWRLTHPDDTQWGVLCTVDDITYKKIMEERLHQNEKLAYTGTLAASLAHEIRNPLAGIRASMQVISRRLEQEKDRQLCAYIVGEVDRVNILIEDLLNLSRTREKQKVMLDVRVLFDELVLLYSKIAENNHVTFSIDIPESVMLYADPGDVRQVMINLINNSIKAMPRGGKIAITAHWNAGAVITLNDTGSGMTPQRLEAARSGTTGGLGLSIVGRLVAQNGGSFSIQSQPEQGTQIQMIFKGVASDEV